MKRQKHMSSHRYISSHIHLLIISFVLMLYNLGKKCQLLRLAYFCIKKFSQSVCNNVILNFFRRKFVKEMDKSLTVEILVWVVQKMLKLNKMQNIKCHQNLQYVYIFRTCCIITGWNLVNLKSAWNKLASRMFHKCRCT